MPTPEEIQQQQEASRQLRADIAAAARRTYEEFREAEDCFERVVDATFATWHELTGPKVMLPFEYFPDGVPMSSKNQPQPIVHNDQFTSSHRMLMLWSPDDARLIFVIAPKLLMMVDPKSVPSEAYVVHVQNLMMALGQDWMVRQQLAMQESAGATGTTEQTPPPEPETPITPPATATAETDNATEEETDGTTNQPEDPVRPDNGRGGRKAKRRQS